ncbi:cupin domain-containing protein [Agromyces aerolatus]|uniref:cupin domain-containing protein n=1 Tax=Agromyces sp. LY-1074 TaxID=3074080 RepID=UPI0028577D91|nr:MULTISPECIES: cupin domain-containing protein [unclassified Agromyces]MDR5698694.1 cupin domain-containing protein [Agromyces sp. LY-1074]MDR5704988.1 cupin domain-containing protein [Agromyces sp. LY-1358]
MRIISGRSGAPSSTAANTFTGEVWMDGVITDQSDVKINNVIFTPCARTYWHHHEHGQILQVFRGRGFVCGRDGEPRVIEQGDTVWIEPGERHWHGGTPDSLMGHTAITLGDTVWLEEVSDEEYAKAQG